MRIFAVAMAITKIPLEAFLQLPQNVPIFDVRSPSEFAHASIPGAISFPIFDDDERRIIGTAYKQESREQAIKIGLDAFGKKMSTLVSDAEKYFLKNKLDGKEVRVHCWRGGMRSAAVAWLLDLYGFKVYLLDGGYKAFRHWALQQFEKDYPLTIIGGYTGGNKTGLLIQLEKKGQSIVDLEQIAGHMGSAFGNLDNKQQPSQEFFENKLAMKLQSLQLNSENTIWVEGESQRIGNVNIPPSFFKTMRRANFLFLSVPFERRLKHIVAGYGKYSKEKLISGIMRIKKKLGGQETKSAINFLLEDNVEACFEILLNYYDRIYLKSIVNNQEGEREIKYVMAETTSAELNAEIILDYAKHNN